MSPELIVGPFALTLFLVYVVRLLWTEHVKDDDDMRNQRDVALAAGSAAVSALADLASAWEARNKADEVRARRAAIKAGPK